MNIGVILRRDCSGLGIQSRWVASLINPTAVVAVDMGQSNRGHLQDIAHPNVLHATWDARGSQDGARKVAAHFQGCDVVWTAESMYWTALPRRLGRTPLCVHANPELWADPRERNVRPAWPTSWRSEGTRYPVVPHPSPVGDPVFAEIAAANLARTGPARRILHMAAPAMLDRNGSEAMLAALSVYRGPAFTLVVGGSQFAGNRNARLRGLDTRVQWPSRVGDVTVEVLPALADHRDLYRNVDLLVIPRRYAGQNLPATEAAAAGVPVLMTNVDPQDSWGGVDSSISCNGGTVHAMRGGRFTVHDPDPQSIAGRLAAYVHESVGVRPVWQQRAMQWAVANRWDAVRPAWEAWLAPSHR